MPTMQQLQILTTCSAALGDAPLQLLSHHATLPGAPAQEAMPTRGIKARKGSSG
jgi:hypothetical protein